MKRLKLSNDDITCLATIGIGLGGLFGLISLAIWSEKKDREYMAALKAENPRAYEEEMERRRRRAEEARQACLRSDNPKAAAIKAIGESAVDNEWDSSRKQDAASIFQIASDGDDDTKNIAIEELKKLSESCEWDSTKRCINELIKDLVVMKGR